MVRTGRLDINFKMFYSVDICLLYARQWRYWSKSTFLFSRHLNTYPKEKITILNLKVVVLKHCDIRITYSTCKRFLPLTLRLWVSRSGVNLENPTKNSDANVAIPCFEKNNSKHFCNTMYLLYNVLHSCCVVYLLF